eukprot:256315_1
MTLSFQLFSICMLFPPFKWTNAIHWTLHKRYEGDTFFDDWTFFVSRGKANDRDPSHGFVNYTDRNYAKQKGYIGYSNSTGSVYIGADHESIIVNHSSLSYTGRDSVRISTNDVFDGGLFIIQLTHMPQGCATWPSIWFLGNNSTGSCAWPTCGEIDLIEGVDQLVTNWVSMHTSQGCDFTSIPTHAQTGMSPTDCYTHYGEDPHLGCTFTCGANSFGSAFFLEVVHYIATKKAGSSLAHSGHAVCIHCKLMS